MNETIERLAREAGIRFTNYGSGDFIDDGDCDKDKLEAFARLIAQDCSAECERMVMYPGGREESAAHQNVWVAARAIRERYK